jgi:hypothetical protein
MLCVRTGMKRTTPARRWRAPRMLIACAAILALALLPSAQTFLASTLGALGLRLPAVAGGARPAIAKGPSPGSQDETLPDEELPDEEPPEEEEVVVPLFPTTDPSVIRYVEPALLWPRLSRAADALGDRIRVPGKERMTFTAIHTAAGLPLPVTSRVITQWFDRVRIEQTLPDQTLVLGFDGRSTWSGAGPPDAFSLLLVRTLAFDSAEHFFADQMFGAATRELGLQFRLDDNTAEDHPGPFFDVYEVTEVIPVSQEMVAQTRVYWFNSDTRLLERIQYTDLLAAVPVQVEILISWQDVEGQRVPARVERTENSASVLALTISDVTFSPRGDDGIFNNPIVVSE